MGCVYMEKRKNNYKKEIITSKNIALFALIFAFLVVLKIIVSNPESIRTLEHQDFEYEANFILEVLSNGDDRTRLVEENELLEEKVEHLDRMDYQEFKRALGLRSDFCVYFEDHEGNLVAIDGIKSGIGSEKIRINGKPCN